MRVRTFKVTGGRIYDEVNVYAENYGSPYEVLSVAQSRPCKASNVDYLVDKKDNREEWAGYSDQEELFNRIKHGVQDDELISKVQAFTSKAVVKEEEKLVQKYWDVAGACPNVPLFCSGVPECMLNFRRAKVKSKILGICCFVEACSDISVKNYMKCGQILLKLMVKAEKAGYRVRLSACDMYYRHGNTVYVINVNIKAENEHMNLKKALFPLTDIAFVRGLGFGWYARMPKGSSDLGGYALSAFRSDIYKEKLDEVFQKSNPDLKSTVVFSMRDMVSILQRSGEEAVEKFIESKLKSVE